MKITIDTDTNLLTQENGDEIKTISLYSKESFEIISKYWLKIGWSQKYSYTFSWLGRPVIQLPEDLITIQELIFRQKPDIIIETGVAHGGSLIFYASLCKLIGKGNVIGIDIHTKPENRKEINEHSLSSLITLIEGDSTAQETINQVQLLIKNDDSVIIILDSKHSKDHVLKELNLYAKFINNSSYIIVTDGFMKELSDVPKGDKNWALDNPYEASKEFVIQNPDFEIIEFPYTFNESNLTQRVTYWPGCFIKRVK